MANLSEQFGGFGSVEDFTAREGLGEASSSDILSLYTQGLVRHRQALASEMGIPVEELRLHARNEEPTAPDQPSPGTKYAIN